MVEEWDTKTVSELSKEFGVSINTINQMARRKDKMTGNPIPITDGIEFTQSLLDLFNMKLEELKEQVEERDKDTYSNIIGKCKEISELILSYLENVKYSLDDDDDDPETRDLLKLSPENLLDIETELIDDPDFKGAKRVVIKGQKA